MKKFLCCIAFVIKSIIVISQASNYPISDFGAKSDGHTVNTAFINAAVKACASNGGGLVIVPAGIFITGTIELFSNTQLYLSPGAVLSASKDTSDYRPMTGVLFNEGYSRYGLVYANGCSNIGITGPGELNGNGTSFMNGLDKPHMGHDFDRRFTRQGEAFMREGTVFEDGPVSYPFRPGLLVTILNCSNVQIKDVLIKDAPEWTIRLGNCDQANVSGITIMNNPLIPNNDGIHCTNSRNITISDCKIYTGDDGIIVTGFEEDFAKTSGGSFAGVGNRSGISENIVVNNCIITSRSAGIRVGYGERPIRNLIFSNLILTDCNRGIGIFARNGSSIDQVMFSNIIIHTYLPSGHWWGKGEPIHVSAVRDKQTGAPGKIKNISFVNIRATAETGILIAGSPGSMIENISMRDIELTINTGKYTNSYGGNFDLRPAAVKDSAIFKHDIPGIYVDYVSKLTVTDLRLLWGTGLPSFFTYGIELAHCNDVTVRNSSINAASPKFRPVFTINCDKIQLENCESSGGLIYLSNKPGR